MNIIPSNLRSATVLRAKQKLAKMAGYRGDIDAVSEQFVMYPQTLRVVKALSNNVQNYQFDIHSNNTSTDGPYENRLNSNDLFFMSGVSSKVARFVSSAWNPIIPFTYPDIVVHAGGSKAEAASLINVWVGGQLSLKTGPLSRFQNIDMQHCMVVPERIAAAVDSPPQFGPTLEGRGFQLIEPNPILSGKENNVFDYKLGPGSLANLAPASGTNYLVLEVEGVVVVNAAAQVYSYLDGNKGNAAAMTF